MYEKDNDVEFILKMDSVDKKKSGRGIFNRASRLGYYRGGVKFPSDFLTNKEKKKLNGEVKVSSMYTNIKNLPSRKELKEMNIEKAMVIMMEAKENFTNKQLMEHFNVSSGTLYTLFDSYGVTYKKIKKIDNKKEKVTTEKQNEIMQETIKNVQLVPVESFISTPTKRTTGFSIEIRNTYTKEDLSDKLNGIDCLLSDGKYVVEISIKEV